MGEEKPDEELMGKRKSSPRLSPVPLGTGTIMVHGSDGKYTLPGKKLLSPVNRHYPFSNIALK
jgi:hypothetical protein